MTPQAAPAITPQAAKTSTATGQIEINKSVERFDRIYDSIAKRAFEIFDNNGRWVGNDLADWLQAESEILHPVHMEIAETDDALNVRAEVPGFTAPELRIQVDGNRLTISGKHDSQEENQKGTTIYSERCAKEILRSIELPSAVDTAKVKAVLKNGVLSIELSKTAQAKNIALDTKAAN
ncbi:MAG TPA: Hsp20 family protein [Candidatus Acidoferrales bacterium]|jgi:HSP20 family molecular chaperone IbpA|nr:Hsp20 family protein [Candidatus Acidoferrales bacterium]